MGKKNISIDKEDLWVWKESDTTKFTIKFAYRILKGEVQGDGVAMYKGFWRIKAQPSTHITAWRVLKNKIASKVNLERREISMVSSTCSMCGEGEETTTYLFCTCRVAWLV